MTDGIDIRSGGIVAVDTESLRAAADRFALVGAKLDEISVDLGDLGWWLQQQGVAVAGTTSFALPQAARLMAARADGAAILERRLRQLADEYELVELRARLAAAHEADRAADLAVAIARIESADPEAARAADRLEDRERTRVASELVDGMSADVLVPGGLLAAFALVPGILLTAAALSALAHAAHEMQQLARRVGGGTIEQGERLDGPRPPVIVRPTRAPMPTSPPADLASAFARIPDVGDARVRIETYAMPDGSTRYAVYIAGTRAGSLDGAGVEPWDMASNLQLYFGRDSASYEAVRAALDDVGAPAGAEVYLFGHSQGGMIADRLAMEGGYDPVLLATAGSPPEADVGPTTLSVQLRHTDDVVQSLAAGGSAAQVGSPGSMVVERVGDPPPGVQDLHLAPHHLPAYVATARMLDASTDPRTAPLRATLGELQAARSVTAAEYSAQRPTAAPAAPAQRMSPAPPAPAPGPGRTSV